MFYSYPDDFCLSDVCISKSTKEILLGKIHNFTDLFERVWLAKNESFKFFKDLTYKWLFFINYTSSIKY